MKQFFSLNELELIEDYRLILAEAEVLKQEISRTKSFLVKFELTGEFETIFEKVNEFDSNRIYDRAEATLFYLHLKIALIDLRLIVNDNQLNEIYKGYHEKPALFDQLIQDARITPETRREIIQNLNLYLSFKPGLQPAGFQILSQNVNNKN